MIALLRSLLAYFRSGVAYGALFFGGKSLRDLRDLRRLQFLRHGLGRAFTLELEV
jgi:hypothetical protein